MINVEKELVLLADEKYKEFNKKLTPDTKKELLGIRIPDLKSLAKQVVKEYDWKYWIENESKENYFEEVILQGLVLAYGKNSFNDKIPYIKNFVPKIDSWAISDTFVPALKIKSKDLEEAWNFINPYFKSEKEFDVRFAVIMLLDYYIIDEYVDKVIEILDNINHDGYYVKMSVAWCLAEIGIKFNSKLMHYLNNENHLDKFTYNKTLQKMIESRRISDAQKDTLRKMKK